MPRRRAAPPVTGAGEEEPRGVAGRGVAWAPLPPAPGLGSFRGKAPFQKREMIPDLALLLWHSFGTMAVLLQEIVSLYPGLSPSTLSASESNRACNVLALLQSTASHPETKAPFLKARIFEYLYPLLNTTNDTKSFEYLRLTTLGVLGALVKEEDTEAVNSLINSGFVPLFLQVMETGTELCKTVATFIVYKIITDEAGLQYICATPERFFAIARVLASMVDEGPSARLLKHIVLCYHRLTDDPRARTALQTNLPGALRDGTAKKCFKTEDDPVASRFLEQLLDILGFPSGRPHHPAPAPTVGDAPHPGPGPVAGGSPGGSSQAAPSRIHPGLAPTAGGSPGGSSQAGPSHSGPAPTAGGEPHPDPAPGPVAGGSPGGSSQAGPSHRRRR